MAKLTIDFGNEDALQHFVTWLSEQGEQDYWEWMKYREAEEKTGDITVIEFDYLNYRRDLLSPDRVLKATCGRLEPVECECDNTHENNDTVCRYCWENGRRHWDDPEV